jgi:hypothetical protein
MNFEQQVSIQGQYKLKSFDRETGELISESGWSKNQIIRSEATAKLIFETGLVANPPFQLGRTDTNNYSSFENVVGLTHVSKEINPMEYSWVDDNDVKKGWRVVGGGKYKFTPNTTVKGLKANQVGIANFSIAQIKNEVGAAFIYPISPNVLIEIDFKLTMLLLPSPITQLPVYDNKGTLLRNIPCKVNIAVNTAVLLASGYQWHFLLGIGQGNGLTANPTVQGDPNDNNVLGSITPTASRWKEVITTTTGLPLGNHNRRGYIYDPNIDRQYIRFGIPTGVPGVYTSVLFSTPVTFLKRSLTDVDVTSMYTTSGA